MILESLTTLNFKNLAEVSPKFSNLNIFVGPNGSGKSNLVSCLRFLIQAIRQETSAGLNGFELGLDGLGGAHVLDKTKNRPDVVKLKYVFSENSKDSLGLELGLTVQSGSQGVRLQEDALCGYYGQVEPYYFYRFHNHGLGRGAISIKAEDQTKFVTFEGLNANELGIAVLPQILENSLYPPEQVPAIAIRRKLLDFIGDWRIYNANEMNIKAIRQATPKVGLSDLFLNSDGSNLPLVMHNLIQTSLDFEDAIQQVMISIFPRTRKLRTVVSGRASLAVEWWLDGIVEPLFLDEMSDGTVRLLLMATMLKSPKLPSLLVLDEPEMGLHVAWMPLLANWIKEAAQCTQVFLITHSPDLLDAFTEEHVENVYRFRVDAAQHVAITPLTRAQISRQLEDGWELGDLYRAGDPDFGAWPW